MYEGYIRCGKAYDPSVSTVAREDKRIIAQQALDFCEERGGVACPEAFILLASLTDSVEEKLKYILQGEEAGLSAVLPSEVKQAMKERNLYKYPPLRPYYFVRLFGVLPHYTCPCNCIS